MSLRESNRYCGKMGKFWDESTSLCHVDGESPETRGVMGNMGKQDYLTKGILQYS